MKKILNIGGIILFILIIITIIAKYSFNKNTIEKNHKYSICTVQRFEGVKGGFSVGYSFFVLNTEYVVGEIVQDGNKSVVGNRFYVKFYPPNPKNSEILLDRLVPDSIKEAPPQGWDKIPE
ncbi:MAG TPA: hypothetical protein PKI01_04080 [Bacteroidales bacterium]|nr:hypothetical protein [Bacteroidales bacterium]